MGGVFVYNDWLTHPLSYNLFTFFSNLKLLLEPSICLISPHSTYPTFTKMSIVPTTFFPVTIKFSCLVRFLVKPEVHRQKLQSLQTPHCIFKSRTWGYKTFSMLNSAEHEICPANESQIIKNCKYFLAIHSWANKYENANYSWYFHIYLQRKFHAWLRWAWKKVL